MIHFKQACYAAYISTDEWHSELFGYFIKESDAKELSKGRGWYGSDGTVKPEVVNIRIYESKADYLNRMEMNEKEVALGKLTDREKQLLGLL